VKITIESTTKVTRLVLDGGEVPARVWEGHTESGVPVHCFIARLAPTIPVDDPRQAEFQRELIECRQPSAELQAIPLRMIL
jgi:hypothetical protein